MKFTEAKKQFLAGMTPKEATLGYTMNDNPLVFLTIEQLRVAMENKNVYVFTQTLKPAMQVDTHVEQEDISIQIMESYFRKKKWSWYARKELTKKEVCHWHGWLWNVNPEHIKQLKKYMGQKLGNLKIYRVYELYQQYPDWDHPEIVDGRRTSFVSQYKYIHKNYDHGYWSINNPNGPSGGGDKQT